MSSPTPGYLKIFHPEKGGDHPVIIRAGAGAGKTTELISRVISFGIEYRKKNKTWPTLVVTTFTVKATQELRERLVKAVLKAQQQEAFYGQSEILEWVQSPMIFITTIHSLVIRYLREFGSSIGLRADFKIDDNPNLKFKIFIKQIYYNDIEFKNLLDPWIESWNWSDLLLMLRQACLVRLKIGKALDYVTTQSQINIFNVQKQKILDLTSQIVAQLSVEELTTPKRKQCFEYMQQVHYKANFESPDYIATLTRVTFANDQVSEWLKQLKEALKEQIRPNWDYCFLNMIESDNASFVALCEYIYTKWLEQRILDQSLSLDEIELFGNHLIEHFPLTADKFSQAWLYWYIDEYQDTSPLQVKILEALMGDRNGFFVGDPQQSIYLFRGARPQVFQERWKALKEKSHSELLVFDINYRTQAQVLDFINRSVTQKSPVFSSMQVGSTSDSKLLTSIDLYEFEDGKTSQVNRYLAGLSVFKVISDKMEQGFSLGQIAILARKRSELKQLAYILRQNNINFQLHVGGAFYQRREIIDALSLLRFISQPDDIKNLINLLRLEGFAHSKLQVSGQKLWTDLVKEFGDCPVVKQLQHWLELQKQWGQFKTWIIAIKETQLFETFYIQDSTGQKESNIFKLIQTVYDQQDIAATDWHQFYWNFINQFEQSGDEADAVADLDPNRIQLMTVHGSKGLEFECVIYLHMPQKGQNNSQQSKFYFSEQESVFTLAKEWWIEESEEWKYLFPPICDQDQKSKRDWERQEADRVVYVALTRTKSNLIIIKPEGFQDEWSNVFLQNQEFIKLDLSKFAAELVSTGEQSLEAGINKEVIDLHSNSISTSTLAIDLPSSVSWDNYFKQRAGIEAHLLFQRARFNANLFTTNDDLQWALTQWPVLRQGLERGFAEWGYLYREDDKNIQGRIDLWWFDQTQVYIVDYKTGHLLSEVERWKQLSQYALAIKKSGYQIPAVIELIIINFQEKVIVKKWLNQK